MKNFLMQFYQIWRQFGASQKITVVLSIGVIMAMVAGLLVWSSQPKLQLLYGRMNGDDMAQVVSVLESHGIQYKIAGGGSSVMVPSDKVYSVRMELAGKGVPRGEGVGFEIFDESKFGISDFVQRTNFTRAIQGELSRTISQLKGVRSARVMVSVPENRLLAEQSDTRATASVFVDVGGSTLSESSVNSIRYLVANSVEGLRVDDVAVVDNSGNVLSEALMSDGTLGLASGRLRLKQGLEDYFAGKVETMLSKVVGRGNVVARVSVKVDTETSTMVEERYDPGGQVIRSQTITEDVSTTDDMSPRGVGGAAGGGEADLSATAQPLSSKKDNAKKKTIAYEISKSTREVVKTPGTLEEVNAAVFIALVEKEESGKVVTKPRTEDEMKLIREMVVNALGAGMQGGADVERKVTIQEVPFMKEEVVQTAGFLEMPEWAHRWMDALKGFLGILIALVMFKVFFKMLKSHNIKGGSFELVEGGGGSAKNVTSEPTADLINELIKQKPENVSAALKNWVASTENKS